MDVQSTRPDDYAKNQTAVEYVWFHVIFHSPLSVFINLSGARRAAFQELVSPRRDSENYRGDERVVSTGLILGLHPANERRRYFLTTFPIGWAQA